MMNKLAVITGASGDIGHAVVQGMLNKKFEIVASYCSDKNTLSQLEQTFQPRLKIRHLDVLSAESIQCFTDEIIQDRVPDVIINCVGVARQKLFLDQDPEDFFKVMSINFNSVVSLCKHFSKNMAEKGCGQIINISSAIAGKKVIGSTAYSTSKVALEHFSKMLALELARFQVRVNCISPGFVESEMTSNYIKTMQEREFYKLVPMRRILLPEEVAKMVILLAEDEIITTGSVFCTGNGENIA